MWQTLLDWLPDVEVGVFEIRDLLNLCLAALGVYLAYLAIQIAKKQDRLLAEQLARKAILTMHLSRPDSPRWDGKTLRLVVENDGKKGVPNYYWFFLIPDERIGEFRCEWDRNPNIKPRHTVVDGRGYVTFNGYNDLPIFANRSTGVGSVIVDLAAFQKAIEFRWRISCDEGEFPADKLSGTLLLEPTDLALS